jgi:hypothetical protein
LGVGRGRNYFQDNKKLQKILHLYFQIFSFF